MLVCMSYASAALVLEYYTYTAHALPGQPATFTFRIKNTATIQTTATIYGVDVSDLHWTSNSGTVVFAPGESKSITLNAQRGTKNTKTVDTWLFVSLSPDDPNAQRTMPLFIVFANSAEEPRPTVPPAPTQNTSVVPNQSSASSPASFCSTGQKGTALRIEKAKIKSSGKKTTWTAGDTIDLEIEVANTGTTTLQDVILELGLRNTNGKNEVKELNFKGSENSRINLGNMKEEDEEETTFTFTVSPSLKEGNYQLLLKAYKKGAESGVCTESVASFDRTTSQSITIEREDNEGRFIRFDKIGVTPTSLTCGDTIQLTSRVTNIGDEDQDRVKVLLRNSKLSLDMAQEIRSGLDEGEDTTVTFTTTLPESASGIYDLELSAEYEYKNGVFRTHSEIPQRISISIASCDRANARAIPLNLPEVVVLTSTAPETSSELTTYGEIFTKESMPWALGVAIIFLLALIIIFAFVRRPRARHAPRSSLERTRGKGNPNP